MIRMICLFFCLFVSVCCADAVTDKLDVLITLQSMTCRLLCILIGVGVFRFVSLRSSI